MKTGTKVAIGVGVVVVGVGVLFGTPLTPGLLKNYWGAGTKPKTIPLTGTSRALLPNSQGTGAETLSTGSGVTGNGSPVQFFDGNPNGKFPIEYVQAPRSLV